MAIKTKNGSYQCLHCEKLYDSPSLADSCRDNHDLVYISMLRSDLSRLIQFLYTKDDDLLTPTLVNTLRKHMRGAKKEDVVSNLYGKDG